ncbi:MAG: Wzz/FepE/Etk N-terminal domain-containing protein [Armatimonadota bacterium]
MEFLEYYRIVRDRIWIVVLLAAVAAIVVIVYSVLPPSSYSARGQILVQPEAAVWMQRSGNQVEPVARRDFWLTLIQVARDEQAVLYPAAERAGITDPRVLQKLKPVSLRQESGSSIATLTASAPAAEQATALTEAAMVVLAEAWDRVRERHAEELKSDLATVLTQVEEQLGPLQAQMDAYAGERAPGTPEAQLASLEARVSAVQGQVQGAELELELAEDNLAALRGLAQSEFARPLGEQQYGGLVTGELRTLLDQLDDARDELARQLEVRTEEHPSVKALQQHIAALEEDIAEIRRSGSALQGAGSPLAAQILDAQLKVSEARRRIDLLRAQELELSALLPAYRARADEFGKIATRYAELVAQKTELSREIDELEAEQRRLAETDDITPVSTGKAALLPTGRTLAKTAFLFLAAVAAGVIVGVLAILLLHYMDVSFKNAYEAERMIRRRVLASIPRSDIMLAPVTELEAPLQGPGVGPAAPSDEGREG